MRWPAWTGMQGKTLWDLLQLLIVPAMLAGIALAFNASQTSRENKREDRRTREDRALARAAREDATLDAYLAQMRDLILNRHLLTRGPGYPVDELARVETLVTLRRLDGRRKGEIARFLDEARLIDCPCKGEQENNVAPVSLDGADLRGADLVGADLAFDNFEGADLRGARFGHTAFYGVRFSSANLAGASFDHDVLSGHVFFDNSNLKRAHFDGAEFLGHVLLNNSCLSRTSFVGVSFTPQTVLNGAYGQGVDLRATENFAQVQTELAFLTSVRFDKGAARPRGWGLTGSRLQPSSHDRDVCTSWR